MGKKLSLRSLDQEPEAEQKETPVLSLRPLDEQPVKKKDDTLSSPETTGTDSEMVASQPGQPSKKSGKEKSTEVSGSPMDPFGIGETIVRQLYTGFADLIPKSLRQASEVGISALQASNVDEYIKRNKSTDFQKYVRKKAGLKWYDAFDIDKYLPEYRDQFVKDKNLTEVQEKIKAKQPEIIKRRLATEQYAKEQQMEARAHMGSVPQSYKDVDSIKGGIQYAFNQGAQAAWQIPLVIATRGLSGVAMESAEGYDQQLEQIVQAHNTANPSDQIDREEAIKRNLDKPAEGQIWALAAAGLDRFSAGGLLNLVKKGGAPVVKKLTAVATETLTEPTQGMLEEMSGASGAGLDVSDAARDAWLKNYSKRIDEAAGGLFGSAGPTLISQSKDPSTAIKEAVQKPIENKEDLHQKASIIQQAIDEQAKTTTPGIEPVSEVQSQETEENWKVGDTVPSDFGRPEKKIASIDKVFDDGRVKVTFEGGGMGMFDAKPLYLKNKEEFDKQNAIESDEGTEPTTVGEALEKFDRGDSLITDLVNQVEELNLELNDKKLTEAVNYFRNEQAYDNSISGRHDMQEVEDKFLAMIQPESVAGKKSTEQVQPKAETDGTQGNQRGSEEVITPQEPATSKVDEPVSLQEEKSKEPLTSQNEKARIEPVPSGKEPEITGIKQDDAESITRAVQEASPTTPGAQRSPREIKKVQDKELEKYAREKGAFIDNVKEVLGEKLDGGTEQDVYLNKEGDKVIKINGLANHSNWAEFWDRLNLQEELFPDTAYKLIGFTKSGGRLSAVSEQPYIEGTPVPRKELIEDLSNMGFHQVYQEGTDFQNVFYNPDLGVRISDVHEENVKKDPDGNIRYIDPMLDRENPFATKEDEENWIEQINKSQTHAQTLRENQGAVPQEGKVLESSEENRSSNVQQNKKGESGQGPPKTESKAQDEGEGQVNLSGIKKELAPEDIQKLTPVDKRTSEDVFNQGKQDVDSGKIDPEKLIESILTEARALQANEVAALVYYKAQLDNRVRETSKQLQDAVAIDDNEAIAYAKTELEALSQQLNDYYEMSVITASQQSLAFRLRKMLVDSEYNLQSQIAQYKAANNGEIPAEIQEKFEKLDKQLQEANLKIEQLQKNQQAKVDEDILKKLREIERRARSKQITSEKKKTINDFFNKLKVDTKSSGALHSSVIPGITLLPHVWNGSIEAVKQAVLAGYDIASAIDAGIEYIKKQGEKLDEGVYRQGMEKLIGPMMPSKKEQKAPSVKDGKLSIPKELIKNLVSDGVNDINDLTEKVFNIVKSEHPDISIREVRDSITAYGKVATMSQEEIDVEIRGLKRMGRLLSQLEDVENKKRPLRSGLQRDKLSDEERRLNKELREAIKDLPVDPVEENRVWKTALDRVKSRLKNQIIDLEDQIKNGKKTTPKKGIVYDEEAKALQSQRDELKSLIESIEGKSELSDEQRLRMAIKNSEKAIDEYERRIKEKDFTKKEKRELPDSNELNDLKARQKIAKAEYEKLKSDLGIAEKERIETRKKNVQKSINDLERRIKEKDFVSKIKPPVKPDKELGNLMRERERIRYEFDVAQEKNRLANRTKVEKLQDFAIDAINLPKSLVSSLDFSAALRQGGYFLPTHPRAWLRAFVEMFRQAASKTRYDNWIFDLKGSDIWPIMQQSKLFIADNNAKLSAREELFLSQLSKKIPLIGESIRINKKLSIPGLDIIGASNRAYAGFLNKLRADIFSSGVDQLQKSGLTFENNPEAYQGLADFINNATGRGKLMAAGTFDLEKAAPVLNSVFFSPRFLASRLNLLNPVYYAKLPAPVRRKALASSLAYIGFGMAVLALFTASDDDWEVELDPRSTDFGKLRKGDTRYDIWGGFQSIVRLLAQLATGQRKSSTSGEIIELDGKKFGSDDRLDVLGKFFRGKLAPIPGSTINLIKGENLIGEPVTLQSEAIRNITPLYIQDMYSIFEKDGAEGAVKTAIPSIFGIGVGNYNPQERKKKKEKNEYEFVWPTPNP